MPSTNLTQENFASFQFNGISIQEVSTTKNLLIMMLTDAESSIQFLHILKEHEFRMLVTVNPETGRYYLTFQFQGTNLDIQIDTFRTMESYPPLEKFENNNIHFISTGVWTGNTEHGRSFTYNHEIHRLGDLDIGKSLEQATAVQFVSFGTDEPSAVLLIFNDYDHIFEAEADKAYNKLLDLEHSRPLLEISPQEDGLLNLRIWDVLIDLDIRINSLVYSPEQLEMFLFNNDEGLSFAFALGFPPTDERSANIANTYPGEIKLITIFGYTYRQLPI